MAEATVDKIPLSLERDWFMRSLIRELAGTLEDVAGVDDASSYISIAGANLGESIDASYRKGLAVERLGRSQVVDVLVDLTRRIQGDFFILDETENRITLGNRACPFGDKVLGRPSLCMMTSNVFGFIAANNLGYAKVELQKTIARGDPGCCVVVHLKPTVEADRAEGREYYGVNC